MTNIVRSSKQAARDRAALKRLRKSGIYKGKIDLRKAPSRYQLAKIKTLAKPKASKKSKTKQPLPPKSKTPGAKVRRSRMTEKQVRDLKPNAGGKHSLTTYALPFLRKGQSEPEWRRFTRTQLTKFLAEYKAGDDEGAAEWRSYAVKETWTFNTKSEVQDMRSEVNTFFSGVRVDQPVGKILKRRVNKMRGSKRGYSKRGKK